jgi:hypothetical protein
MTVESTGFFVRALYDALDAQRRAREMSWQQVAREIGGISASTLTGMRERSTLEGDGVLQMVRWLRRTPESFVPTADGASTAITMLPQARPGQMLRFDAGAIYEALDSERVRRGMTWQQVANEVGGSSAADLTRLAQGGRVGFPKVLRVVGWLGRPVADFTRITAR